MNLSRLRLITFDVTDTLLKFRSSPGLQYGEIGALYGVLADGSDLAANFKTHWYRMNKEHPNFGLATTGWETWWKEIISGTFRDSRYDIDEKKLDAMSSHLIELYKTSTCWQQCYGALGLLSYLSSKGIPLGVISNFDPRLPVTLENTKLRHYFQFILTSYEAGFEKPDEKIFIEAMKKSKLNNLKPEECLHIGDTPISDYQGAKNSGWNAFLVHEKKPAVLQEKYGNINIDCVFSSLYELHRALYLSNDKSILRSGTT